MPLVASCSLHLLTLPSKEEEFLRVSCYSFQCPLTRCDQTHGYVLCTLSHYFSLSLSSTGYQGPSISLSPGWSLEAPNLTAFQEIPGLSFLNRSPPSGGFPSCLGNRILCHTCGSLSSYGLHTTRPGLIISHSIPEAQIPRHYEHSGHRINGKRYRPVS